MHNLNTVLHNNESQLISNKGTRISNNKNDKMTTNRLKYNSNNLNVPAKTTTIDVALTNLNQEQHTSQLDIIRENRLSQIISLYSKGLTQAEIAEKMQVNQLTSSRDLHYLQQESQKNKWKYLNKDLLFEYVRFIVRNNAIYKKL